MSLCSKRDNLTQFKRVVNPKYFSFCRKTFVQHDSGAGTGRQTLRNQIGMFRGGMSRQTERRGLLATPLKVEIE